jgi:hypothetical protein
MSTIIESAVREVIAANRLANRIGHTAGVRTAAAKALRLAAEQWEREQAEADAALGVTR